MGETKISVNDLNLYSSRGIFLKYPIEEYIQYYSLPSNRLAR